MTPVSIRDATPDDSEAIARIARASWAETYRDIFEPAFITEFLDANYQPASLAEQAERAAGQEDHHFLVAERDGEVVAFAQLGVGSRGPELFRIYADPAHFGTGAGSALLDELHRRLAGRVDSYVVEVHSKNARGRTFYDRQGFVIVGEGTHVPGGDLVLRRTLAPARPALPVETERLRLRSIEADDAERLFEIYGDAETMRYVGRTGRPIVGPGGDAPRGRRDPPARTSSRVWPLGHGRARGLAAGGRRRPGVGRGPRTGRRSGVHPAARPMGAWVRDRGAASGARDRARAAGARARSSRWRIRRTTPRGG